MADKLVAAGDTLAAKTAARLQSKGLALTPAQSARFEPLPTNNTTQPYPISQSRGVRNDSAPPSPRQPEQRFPPVSAEDRRETSTQNQTIGSTRFDILPNKLDAYENYAYGLSLHYMSVEKFNNVIANGESYTTSDQSVLIASSARASQSFSRNQYFKDTDFSIENLRIQTVVGLNYRSKGSNAIQIEFTVLETHGMTLIERFIKLAQGQRITSWDEIPIMLQIDFFGNSIIAPEKVPNTTKLIPIKFINCKISVSSKGSEYRFTAVPIGHAALLQNAISVPVTMSVTAETLGDFFSGKGKNQGNAFAKYDPNTGTSFDPKTGAGEFGEVPRRNAIIESFPLALNQFQDRLVELKEQEYADTYRFVIPESMKNLKILSDPRITNSFNRLPMNAAIQDSVNSNLVNTQINTGTSITDAVAQIMRQSEFFKKLVNINSVDQEGPIEVYKVVPKIELGKWDNIRKTFQKIFTFYIVPFTYHNQKYPYARRSVPRKDMCVKQYFHAYTGKNDQIIDFRMDYNVLFYTALSSNPDKFAKLHVQQQRSDKEAKTKESSSEGKRQGLLKTNQGDLYTPNKYQHVSVQRDINKGQMSELDPDMVRAGDLYKSIMSTSGGDMLNLDLKISGDPDFIKQDDVFLSPDRAGSGATNSMNSINMDVREVHIFVEFRNYNDIDPETGGMVVDPEFKNSSGFSGVYRVLQVENIFEKGLFTQTLNCIRLPNPGQDNYVSSNNINPRSKTTN